MEMKTSEENTPIELIPTVNMERINFSFPVMNSAPIIAPNCENKQKPITHWKDLKLMDPIEMAGQTELQSICMCIHWYINILSFTKFLALFQFTGATALLRGLKMIKIYAKIQFFRHQAIYYALSYNPSIGYNAV